MSYDLRGPVVLGQSLDNGCAEDGSERARGISQFLVGATSLLLVCIYEVRLVKATPNHTE